MEKSRKHISIMIWQFFFGGPKHTCGTDTGIRLHCCGLQTPLPTTLSLLADTHVLPRTISIKKPSLGIAIKKKPAKKTAPQKYANWQIDIGYGLETAAEMWAGSRTRSEAGFKLLIMCPVIATNGESGSLPEFLPGRRLGQLRCVIFNWLVLSSHSVEPFDIA